MTKTVLDIHGEECFFNENDTVCEGHTYIDINLKICRIMQTKLQSQQLNNITSYSSFLDDPALGNIDANDPDYTHDNTMSGHPKDKERRLKNLKNVRKSRKGYRFAGGDGSYDNPITIATSTQGGQIGNYSDEVGNIYWVPFFKKYIIIEDINDTDGPSSIDLWSGPVDIDSDKIQYYSSSDPLGGTINIKIKEKIVTYSKCDGARDGARDGGCVKAVFSNSKKQTQYYSNWQTGNGALSKSHMNFITDLQDYFNDNHSQDTINRYIYSSLAVMAKCSMKFKDSQHINAYLAPSGGFGNKLTPADIIPHPLINYKWNTWNDPQSPNILAASSEQIKDSVNSLPDEQGQYWYIIDKFNDYDSKQWGIFCDKCFDGNYNSMTDIWTGSYKKKGCQCATTGILPGHPPHFTASADAYYLPI